ncbi:MAG: hypothetical protein ACOCG5_10580 [Candidatus Alkaliphilus sp. MAG34]|nr:hypothetical protein [Clostridiales bacterium]
MDASYFSKYSTREGMIVRKWINNNTWLRNAIRKFRPDNTGFHDYKIQLKDGTIFTVEVKEEEYYWYNRTGNIGLDFISAFYFRSGERERYWKNRRHYWVPIDEIDIFLNRDIDVSKWGKLRTCDADVQLFYIENKNRAILMKAYNNNRLQDQQFINYIKGNYRLRINKKSDYGLSDSWESAAFFVKPQDRKLIECEINSLEELRACTGR